jgi:hypothetical protein
MAEPLATQYYLPADASNADVQAAGKAAMANYEKLNTGAMPLQPAGVYKGTNWIPAGIASTYTG